MPNLFRHPYPEKSWLIQIFLNCVPFYEILIRWLADKLTFVKNNLKSGFIYHGFVAGPDQTIEFDRPKSQLI
jgi:hypothetical protein